ncbi:MAG: DEAD/DEAH box helicase [bacterium]|nr:DEAD/DEAH box helicase [bacterium]
MDVFELRDRVISEYGSYVRSFITIRDRRIEDLVDQELAGGRLWPQPLIQLNPNFKPGEPLQDLVDEGLLHPECLKIFRKKPTQTDDEGPLRFHQHQVESIRAASAGDNYVLTTGTGSGKSLAYIVPIVDHVLHRGSGRGIQAIVIYPLNALANSQLGELEKFLCHGYPDGQPPVTFRRYTGQESEDERREIIADPPDILLTNYVMLELVLTRPWEHKLVSAADGLRFLVLDELHTYRGRQGADVALLARRVREMCRARELIYVGTSATLAGGGTWGEQQSEVAEVASNLFGAEVESHRVIGETLQRLTPPAQLDDPGFMDRLADRIRSGHAAEDQNDFLADPLASWTETALGLEVEPGSDRLIRAEPRALVDLAPELARSIGVDADLCEGALREILLAGYRLRNDAGQPSFAFRLHQFVAKGEAVYATLAPEAERFITLQAQQYAPETERQRILLPFAFCRECGQEYYVVRRQQPAGGPATYFPRELSDRFENDDGEPGFLHLDTVDPWPSDAEAVHERLPESWMETKRSGKRVVRKARLDRLPREIFLSPDGEEGSGDLRAHYFRAPFLFCLHCRITYDAHQTSDYGKLATLGSEGRSTATSVLSLAAIRELRRNETLPARARKLLSFTDNRQDASLQAGHFNDFVEITLLRSGLWRAIAAAGVAGLRHDQLTQKVFEALNLPLESYAVNPAVQYLQLEETQRAMRQMLGYYLYRDLQRGWRVTSPNLEQSGLLSIDYVSLEEFCGDQQHWDSRHAALATARPAHRERVCRLLLEYLRRELAIRVGYLDPVEQESLRQLSSQYLIPPWAFDESERLLRSRIVLPRSRGGRRAAEYLTFLSPRGGLGLLLKRAETFPDIQAPLRVTDAAQILEDLLEALTIPGLVHRALEPRDGRDDDVAGYQLNASAMVWRAGDGTQGYHDPIRVPNAPEEGLRTNPFFVEFYRGDTDELKALEAREHTAQVPGPIREEREEAFREARLPILYCSPTMELGVDIAQLNVVNLRNVPPTPANYAQRSGRAGRSGQPAFVFTYCSAGSPHDQYFFKRPGLMVSGAVTPPRLDLANEDLVRAHVHAIWLGLTRVNLGNSLADILDVSGDDPSLEILPQIRQALDDERARRRALELARDALRDAMKGGWLPDDGLDAWLQHVIDTIPTSLESALERWRGLYRAALRQSERQSRIVRDASREPRDRDRARRLRDEAEAQLRILLEVGLSQHSDFYSYRYLASEGFLPGYNFPRLPLSAYIPGRRRRREDDEFLSRPRFLAISEFGPRSFLYYEGSRYVINKVILPVEGLGDSPELTRRAVLCHDCGYLHPLADEPSPDLCESCREPLPPAIENFFRMQNVATRRRDRINSDEEERFRLGYELKSGVRLPVRGGRTDAPRAVLERDGEALVDLIYGHAATLWRINWGWRRRRKHDQTGFVLDIERGYWSKSQVTTDDPDDPMSPRTERVIPYVEDRRNCLLVEPGAALDASAMASLQAALKSAIQAAYQLEDRELQVEPLPDADDRRRILIYEASEGGAGALRRLVELPRALPEIARTALDICHFDPETGEDLGRAPGAPEDCEAACYDCLLSYTNQRDHRLVDRQIIRKLLLEWAGGTVSTSPGFSDRKAHLRRLVNLTDSGLERRWLELLQSLDLALPDAAQELIEACGVRPDFLYREHALAVFIDGPHHGQSEVQREDRAQEDRLQNQGFGFVRFSYRDEDEWPEILERYPSVFGRVETVREEIEPGPEPVPVPVPEAIDLELFDEEWHPLVRDLAEREGIVVDAGGDVLAGGRVIGADVAVVEAGGRRLRLVDARDPAAEKIREALDAGGERALLIEPEDEELAERVLAALEDEP